VLFDAAGAVVDTLGWNPSPAPRLSRPPAQEPDYQTITLASGRYEVPRPDLEMDQWIGLPDGRIVIDMAAPTRQDDAVLRITRLDLDGDTLFDRHLPYTPTGYSSDDLDSMAYRTARFSGRGGGAGFATPDPAVVATAARAIREKMSFPPFRLPVSIARLGDDQSIWLLRTGEGNSVWIVLDPDARPRGEVELPRRIRPSWMRGDTFWAVVPGELDVPWLVRYRIEPAG
jgi:hypothetical protein